MFLVHYKNGFPLMKNVLMSLANNVLITLVLGTSVADAAIQKKIQGSGKQTTSLITSYEEMKDIIKIS